MASGYRGLVKKRTIWLFLIFLLGFVGLAGRLAYIQVFHYQKYKKWADRIRDRVIETTAFRGCIYDRGGRPLAVSIETASIYANRNEVKDHRKTATRLAELLDKDAGDIEKKLDSKSVIIWLAKQVDPRIGDQIWKMRSDFPGIGRERDYKRVYPSGSLASQILGFANTKNRGREGLEFVLDNILAGRSGQDRAELGPGGRPIPATRHVERKPENGKNIYLTIDIGIQNIAEQALAKMAKTYQPESACAVVMDPRTGEILALANYPGFDPNKPSSSSPKSWRNRAVADLYEPGSTQKVVTVAASLNEGISQYEVVAQCSGKEKIKGGRVSCTLHQPFLHGHGGVDMYRLMQQSCNIAAAKLAFRLGAKKLYKYEKAFGLLDKPDSGFGCEAVGAMLPPEDWRLIRLANIGFGQGIAVTALQMTGVYATIANGGVRVEPQVIREIRNPDGSVYKPFKVKKVQRVVSEKAAFATTKTLVSCVQVGTGKTAKIEGRTVAGKTGSAQIAKPRGGYQSGAFIASFMGFAPAYKPRLVIAVVVNRPHNSHWGATVAAPVFQEIGEKALWYLKVPADVPVRRDLKHKREGGKKDLV